MWCPGDPTSGLLPRISSDPPGEYGAADKRVQAYCFRMCLTNVAGESRAVPAAEELRPEAVRAARPHLSRRRGAACRTSRTQCPTARPTRNNYGPFGTDNIGCNYDYPEASYERRREIIAEHADFQQGLMYFLANDPRCPRRFARK